jgi:hypothetical protein
MAFSAGRFGRMMRGVLLIGLLVALGSCSKTTVAGVLLNFETDGTLDPDTLHVTITANGQTPLDWCYPITNPATFFPTTLAIAPNGDPTETVSVTASVLRAGATLDVRQNYITEVPNDRVLELDILFSSKCSAQISSVVGPPQGTNCPYGVAASLCPPRETCSSATGLCGSNVVPSSTLPDAGSPFAAGGSSGPTGGSGACAGNAFRLDGGGCMCEESLPTLCKDAAAPPQCVNTTLDSNNCGGCGATCSPTAACNGGVCGAEPTQLVPPSPGCVSMRVVYDSRNIYWSDMGHGSIASVSTSGGSVTTIAAEQEIAAVQDGAQGVLSWPKNPLATPLLVRDGTVFWIGAATRGGIGTTILSATAGTAPKTLLTMAMDPGPSPVSATDAQGAIETPGQSPAINAIALSPDASTLYFAAGTRFYSIPTTGTGPVTYVGYTEGPEHGEATALVADDTYLYYLTDGSANVEILSFASMCDADAAANEMCPVRAANSRTLVYDTIVARVNSLYWGDDSRVFEGSVSAALSAVTGIPGTAFPGTAAGAVLTGFAIGTEYAYFGEPVSDDTGYIEKGLAPPFESGETPSAIVIARGQPWPMSFALDGTHVYWTTSRCDINYIADSPQ